MSLFGLYLVTFSSFNHTGPDSQDLVSLVELFRWSMSVWVGCFICLFSTTALDFFWLACLKEKARQVEASSVRFYTLFSTKWPHSHLLQTTFLSRLKPQTTPQFLFWSCFLSVVYTSSVELFTGVPDRTLSPAGADDSSITGWHRDLTPLQRLTSWDVKEACVVAITGDREEILNGGGAYPLSSSLLASLFLRPQVVFSKGSPTQRKTVSLYRRQDIRPWSVCIDTREHTSTCDFGIKWSHNFLQVIK